MDDSSKKARNSRYEELKKYYLILALHYFSSRVFGNLAY